MESFCKVKENIKELKKTITKTFYLIRRYLQAIYPIRYYYPNKQRTHTTEHQKKKKNYWKMGRGYGFFSKEDIQVTHRNIEICLLDITNHEENTY